MDTVNDSGGVGVSWSVMWLATVYDTPDSHPGLDKAERRLHTAQGTSVAVSSERVVRAILDSHHII